MQINNLCLNYDTQVIFKDVNLIIPDKDKIGVVGVNGAGKTTFFKILMNIEKNNSGSIKLKNNYRIDWLPQVIGDVVSNMDITVFDYLKSGRPIDKLQNKLASLYDSLSDINTDYNLIYKKIDKINSDLDYWESYAADSILLKLIDDMNINGDMLDKKLKELSGGQKSKVAFARLLYSKPEIMLLDEPTNHMDFDTKVFITNYLKNYKGTVLIISHDVSFLNEVTNKTLFIDKRTKNMKLFNGNYDKFVKLESEYENNLINLANIQQKEESKLREIVLKYSNSSGNRKKMAQDREKKLEKLMANKIEVLDTTKKVNIKMEMNQELNNMPINVENISFKYDNNQQNVINRLSFNIYKGEKFLIVGQNGVGKSTLLKLLTGKLLPQEGKIYYSDHVEIGYYAQELEGLDLNKTILENFNDANLPLSKIRSVLGNFLFHGDDVNKKVGVLSPGERARVALAKLSISGANNLFLDEPTNHLDPETQNIIGEVFASFKGSMIIVSHNPEFVKKLGIERILILPSGKIDYYDDNIIDYYHNLNTKE